MTSEFHKIWPSHADHAARMKDEFDMYYGGECPMKIKEASWISLKQAASTVVPVFRKQFLCGKPVRSAALEVTCDGVYEAVLNGRRVGDFILAPGWTEYRKRLQV